jgi:glucose/arabinose dehydrogenase
MRGRIVRMRKRLPIALFITTLAAIAAVSASRQASPAAACDPDNGGIKLSEGFCAGVFADNVGPARQLAVAPNGDVYVALRDSRGAPGGIVALRDADKDGRAELKERFGDAGGTGIEVRNGYLYFAKVDTIVRYKLRDGQVTPEPTPEAVVTGLPQRRQHADKGFAFDDKGSLFVGIGVPSNSCQQQDRTPKSPGQDPCPLLDQFGGIWRFDADRAGQTFEKDGKRYATGMRQMIGFAWHQNGLYAVMHGRDQLNTLWPDRFTAEQNAILPSEELMRVEEGANFGWPYCYHDWQQNKRVMMPEYGGDGKQVGRCEQFAPPLVTFPGHWAPNDLMFYNGSQFPARYRGGALIAFHGSWNRAPLPQEGYNVAFVPFSGPKPSGKYEVFADGFAGKTPLLQPNDATYRPMGLAEGGDGSVLISESQKGRIWRVMYRGEAKVGRTLQD